MRPTVTEWNPDETGPNPETMSKPSPEYALKFALGHFKAAAQLGTNLKHLQTVEYVIRQALGHADPLPKYCR